MKRLLTRWWKRSYLYALWVWFRPAPAPFLTVRASMEVRTITLANGEEWEVPVAPTEGR